MRMHYQHYEGCLGKCALQKRECFLGEWLAGKADLY